MTLPQYIEQLVKMGGGLPLTAIANNDLVTCEIDFSLTYTQVRLLGGVLRSNTSVRTLILKRCGLDSKKLELLCINLCHMRRLKKLVLRENSFGKSEN